MPVVKIEDKGCRGCTLCVDICPADVFDFEDSSMLAKATREIDCIGCFSCFYICPSQCISIAGKYYHLHDFHLNQTQMHITRCHQ